MVTAYFSETLERVLYITRKNPEDRHLTELASLSVGLNKDSYQVLILCSVVKYNVTLQNNEDFELESSIFSYFSFLLQLCQCQVKNLFIYCFGPEDGGSRLHQNGHIRSQKY